MSHSYTTPDFKPNFSWRYDEEEDVRQRRQCAQLLGIAAETAEGTLAPIVGSMYVRAHFDSEIWLEAQESEDSKGLAVLHQIFTALHTS